MDYKEMSQKLEAILDSHSQNKVYEIIQPLQPYDLAEIMKRLELKKQIQLITHLAFGQAAQVLEYLEPEIQYKILHHLPPSFAAPLLRKIPSDAIVDLMLAIHPLQAEQLLQFLPDDYREKIHVLMTHPEGTAGSLMTVDYISARAYWSSEEALKHIRKVGHQAELISYIYVTDSHGKLIGIVSLKEIILASPDTILQDIVTSDIISVPADLEQEEVANIFSRYHFMALPVVDAQQRLLGIITVDDVMDVIREEATEDVQKLGGSEPLSEPYFKISVIKLFQKRIVWLFILFIGGAYTADVLKFYQSAVDQVVALSFFIPLLIGTGGNTGSQIVATLVRALGMGEVKFSHVFSVMRKEMITGVLLGTTLGLVAWIRACLLDVESHIGYVVALSALFIVLWASIVSAFLPLFLHRMHIDPAVVSGPLISTLVDGMGLVIYFSVAQWILHL